MALAVPVTIKTTEKGVNGILEYAVSAMQGYRETMEDAHATVLDLDAATATSFFAVYDGHGGPAVAKYCAKHLHDELLKHEGFHNNLPTAVEETFLRMDEMLRDRGAGKELSKYGGNEQWKEYKRDLLISCLIPICVQKPVYEGPVADGCTACVTLIRGNQIIVGNAGDSRCVLSRNGQAIPLSTDHKPNHPAETQRIEAAGHAVVNPGRGNIPRVDDGIAISRAFGDLRYKDNTRLGPQQQAVTAFPEVRSEEMTDNDEFLVIACDGIWDCMTNEELVDYIWLHLHNNLEPWRICEPLLSHCLAQPKGRDNMSVILVRFKKDGEACPIVLPRGPGQRGSESSSGGGQRGPQSSSGGGHRGLQSSSGATPPREEPRVPQHASGHAGTSSTSPPLTHCQVRPAHRQLGR